MSKTSQRKATARAQGKKIAKKYLESRPKATHEEFKEYMKATYRNLGVYVYLGATNYFLKHCDIAY